MATAPKKKYVWNKAKAQAKKRAAGRKILTGSKAEPIVTKENYEPDIGHALRWYMVNWDDKHLLGALCDYVRQLNLKEYDYCIRKAAPSEIRVSATIARLIVRGQYVSLRSAERLFTCLADLREYYPKPVAKADRVTVSVQERMTMQASNLGGMIDEEIDKFVLNGYESDFDIAKFLGMHQVSAPVAKKVGDLYTLALADLNGALGGDVELVEAYSKIEYDDIDELVDKLTAHRDFIQGIVDACGTQVEVAKKIRKPRMKKVKPASVVAAKLRHLKDFPDLGLTSVKPEKIIGADEVWLYVPEKRKLIVYYAGKDLLNVKGTTILNYDEDKSSVKTVRDPKKFFKAIDGGMGKRAMNNAWKGLKAKVSKPRSRTNDTMIILAVN